MPAMCCQPILYQQEQNSNKYVAVAGRRCNIATITAKKMVSREKSDES
jgi:hypothetical protein